MSVEPIKDKETEDYRVKLSELHKESTEIVQDLKRSIRSFITSYGDSFGSAETQKTYLDLKDQFRNWISKYQNLANIYNYKLTQLRSKYSLLIKKDELDSYRDKEYMIEFRIKDVKLYKETIELYLGLFKSLFKDVDNVTYHIK